MGKFERDVESFCFAWKGTKPSDFAWKGTKPSDFVTII